MVLQAMRSEVKDQLLRLKEERVLPKSMVAQWESLGLVLTNDELMEAAQWLLHDNIFWWLSLISHILPRIASHPRFLALVYTIANQVKGDYAQGPFIDALVTIGESRPSLAEELHAKMVAESPTMSDYGGLLLGGAARADDRIREKILNESTGTSGNECISMIRALRVTFGRNEPVDSRVFSILRVLTEKGEAKIKREIALAYLDFYRCNKQESFRQLQKLSRSSDSDARYAISSQLSIRELDTEHLLGLVGILADDTESSVLDQVAQTLAIECACHTVFCLSIIKKWIDMGRYFHLRSITWTLNEIGKANLERSLLIVKGWNRERDYRLALLAPEILWSLGEHNVESLMETLLAWSREKSLRNVSLEGIRRVLSYRPMEGQDKIVNMCFDSLYELAESEGLDADRASRRENVKIFKCCALIDEVKKDKVQIDHERVLSNLERFPDIRDFIGLDWFAEQRAESNVEHPLLTFLARESSITSDAFLSHLDLGLTLIDSREPHVGSLRHGLQDAEMFWQTVSEIDVISRLRGKYEVVIAPVVELEQEGRIFRRNPDLMVTIDPHQVLIEVITPQMFAPLKYFHSAGIPNRLRSKIYTEFKQHFKGQILEKDVVIIVDKGQSEIDYDSAEDYIGGSLQITFRVDKATGKVIDTFPSRADDSIDKLDPETRVILGLILYRRVTETDGSIHVSGLSFPNEPVMNESRRELFNAISNAFLDKQATSSLGHRTGKSKEE